MKVSVVLPVYNAAATVVQAVESILSQTLADFELIIIDDGSTDDTPSLVSNLKNSRVRLVRAPHQGICSTLNRGLEEAQGDYIARMDADDVSRPERLTVQAAFLDAHPEIGLVGCRVSHAGSEETQLGYRLYVEWINSLLSPEQIRLARFIESPFAHPSIMFRRKLVAEHGGYRTGGFPEDYEMILRWTEAGVRMAKVPEVLLEWRDPPGRLSRHDPRYDPAAFHACKAPYLALEIRRRLDGRAFWIWGAGRLSRKRASLLEPFNLSPEGYIDIDPDKIGQSIQSRPVIGPDRLAGPNHAFVAGFVGNRGAREEIRQRLVESGRAEGRDFLFAA